MAVKIVAVLVAICIIHTSGNSSKHGQEEGTYTPISYIISYRLEIANMVYYTLLDYAVVAR